LNVIVVLVERIADDTHVKARPLQTWTWQPQRALVHFAIIPRTTSLSLTIS